MKNVLNIDVVEKMEAPCDLCYGIAAGIGIGLGIVALT